MKAPWHLWVVGIVSLLWNAVGAFDYVMTQTRNEIYMAQFTEEQLAFFYGFPAWVDAAWAVAVWLAVLGSILLLMRSAHAVWAFILSFAAMILTSVHNYVLSDVRMTDVVGPEALYFSLVIVVVGVFLIVYARRMKIIGVLT